MKKFFTTGLVILLPILLTGMIINFLVNVFTQPFLGLAKSLLSHFSFFVHPFLFFSDSSLLILTSKICILFSLFLLIVGVGVIGKLFLMNYLFVLGNYLLLHLPFVNKIYKACQDVVQSLFISSSEKFSQVVFVPFPYQQHLTIGLMTNHIKIENFSDNGNEFISVFIPGTPNPSVGFMVLFRKNQVIPVTMKVDEALKFVVSCGIVMPDFIMTHFTHKE